jgi:hypothetical protein
MPPRRDSVWLFACLQIVHIVRVDRKYHTPAEKVARNSSLLGQIFVEIRSGIVPKDSSWGLVGSELRELEKLCAEMGLAVTLAQINRVNQMVADDSFGRNLPFFGQQLIEIQTRLNDELA